MAEAISTAGRLLALNSSFGGEMSFQLQFLSHARDLLSISARLAQSVEHETLNLRVVGSSPTLGDHLFALHLTCHFVFYKMSKIFTFMLTEENLYFVIENQM